MPLHVRRVFASEFGGDIGVNQISPFRKPFRARFWGSITNVQPRPVELWLHSLTLSPKSRVHIQGVLHQLWEFAMWRGDVPAERNPMTLVTVRGATRRTNAPRSLTFEEFQKFVSELSEPLRTMAPLCLCLGLRISECLA
jgi:integrase